MNTPKNNTYMTILNYTPHAINIIKDDGSAIHIPSSGNARATMVESFSGIALVHNGTDIPLFTSHLVGEITGLPEYKRGVHLIVSQIVYNILKPMRDDLHYPIGLVRDIKGVIIGCKGLSV